MDFGGRSLAYRTEAILDAAMEIGATKEKAKMVMATKVSTKVKPLLEFKQ